MCLPSYNPDATMDIKTKSASNGGKVSRVADEIGEPGPVAAPDDPNIDMLAK